MTDQDQAHPPRALQVEEQPQDLILDDDVKGRSWAHRLHSRAGWNRTPNQGRIEGLSMGNRARLEGAFVEGLSLPRDIDFGSLTYRSIDEWDSVAHMLLVAEIEDTFDVMLETQDVIDMSSFKKAEEILSKYGVAFGSDE